MTSPPEHRVTTSGRFSFTASIDRFHNEALEGSDAQDFGDPSYHSGLERLTDALDRAELTDTGTQSAHKAIVGTLCGRLWAEAGWKRRPESLQSRIVKPVIITGMPRTGTTAIHKMMALDNQFQGLERWLAEFPQPRPDATESSTSPEYIATALALETEFNSRPRLRAVHDMAADEVDECLNVLKQDFVSNKFGAPFQIPAYDRWWLAQSEALSYRRFGNVLRLIGVDDHRTWLLKNPGHIWSLDHLLAIFPDACIVQMHRSPVLAMSSICSLLAMARHANHGPAADLAALGRREVGVWSEAVERAWAVRAQFPERFHDVSMERFQREPLAVVEEIYARFELSLAPAARERMTEWGTRNSDGNKGGHTHDLVTYCLSEGQVRSAFAPYMDRFSNVI